MAATTPAASAPFIVRFYGQGAPDFKGRTLKDMLAFDNRALEDKHDYIQILFPLPEGSPFNSQAPLITKATQDAFAASPELRKQLSEAFEHMAAFYGFDVLTHEAEYSVVPKPNFPKISRESWLTSYDHNHRRIARIIRSLRVLGLEPLALAFHEALVENAGTSVNPKSLMYWERAATRPLHLAPDKDNESATGIVWLRDAVPT